MEGPTEHVEGPTEHVEGPTEHGLGPMAYGLRTTEHGLRTTEHGLRTMAYGRRALAYGREATDYAALNANAVAGEAVDAQVLDLGLIAEQPQPAGRLLDRKHSEPPTRFDQPQRIARQLSNPSANQKQE